MAYFYPAPLVTFVTNPFELVSAINTTFPFNGTTSTKMKFFPVSALLDVITVTGSAFGTTTPQISIGASVGPTFNNTNLVANMTITAAMANTINTMTLIGIDAGATIVVPGSTFTCKIVRAGVGTISTCMVRILLWGFYF